MTGVVRLLDLLGGCDAEENGESLKYEFLLEPGEGLVKNDTKGSFGAADGVGAWALENKELVLCRRDSRKDVELASFAIGSIRLGFDCEANTFKSNKVSRNKRY